MKKYYIGINNQQFGPFTIDELKKKQIKQSTLVWTDGMHEWIEANDIDELKDILISVPPPLPNQINKPSIITNEPDYDYDYTYKENSDVFNVGIMILVSFFLIYIFKPYEYLSNQINYEIIIVLIIFINLILRIFVCIWVTKIANRQNRNPFILGILGCMFPAVTLILLGKSKKRKIKIKLNSNSTPKDKYEILLENAYELYEDKKYSDVVDVTNEAIKLYFDNYECIRLRGICQFKLNKLEESKKDFEILINNKIYLNDAYYLLGNIEILKFNRESAILFWNKAIENKSENAKIKLDLYNTFTGIYILEKFNVCKKLGEYAETDEVIFNDGTYINGLNKIDASINRISYKTILYNYENGIEIELVNKNLKYNIAIALYEINDIKLNMNKSHLEFHLFDNIIISIQFNKFKKLDDWLEFLCSNYHKHTDRIASA
jgi:tetratricopeptide (TPR) repeat protein